MIHLQEFNKKIDFIKKNQTAHQKIINENIKKSGNWIKEKTTKGNYFYVDITKYYDLDTEAILMEKKNASVYADLGYKVYLIPESFNGLDALIDDVQFEYKFLQGGKNSFGERANEAIDKQYFCCFFSKYYKLSKTEAENVINGKFNIKENIPYIFYSVFDERDGKFYFDEKKKNTPINKSIGVSDGTLIQNVPTFHEHTTTNRLNLSNNDVQKSLTYSGHKLQGRTRGPDLPFSEGDTPNKKNNRLENDKSKTKWKKEYYNLCEFDKKVIDTWANEQVRKEAILLSPHANELKKQGEKLKKKNFKKAGNKLINQGRLESEEDIIKYYGNEPKPIGHIYKKLMYLFPNCTDNTIYSGKGHFVSHIVNHHPDKPLNTYKLMNSLITSTGEIYKDEKNGSVVFVKRDEKDPELKTFLALKEDEGKIVLWKTNYETTEKIPDKFKKITLL